MQMRDYPRTSTYDPTDILLIDKEVGGTKQITLGDLITSGGNDLAMKAISDEEKLIATRRHEVGDLFIYENELCKATAEIVIGNTLTLNGNYEKTNIAKEIGTLSTDLSPKLLWTNPNPSVQFGQQTINLNLSDYKFVDVYSDLGTSNSNSYTRAEVGHKNIIIGMSASNSATAYGTIGMMRSLNVTDSGIAFSDCSIIYTQIVSTVNNNYLIPQRIYGVK